MKIKKLFDAFYGDWGLGIGDWGLGIGPQTPTPNPNPPSPIPTLINNLNIVIKKKIK